MIPMALAGSTLGGRHRALNAAVREAHTSGQEFASLEDAPERTPVDRIFKIKLASKIQNVDFIIKNLKDDDMLYVSKALQCKWLLEPQHEHIINPEYLEEHLFPLMKTTAVTKTKRWIYVNLKDPERCRTFFLYYCRTNFKFAVKFLRNCSSDFILEQFPQHARAISLGDFKILCEKNSQTAKVFYDNLLIDEDLKEKYLKNEKQYFAVLKGLLKFDGPMVLDVTEKYFNKQTLQPFNLRATKFIMKHHRTRFTRKPELYAAYLLNLKTVASGLTAGDARELALTLARDGHLSGEKWFDYKAVEPLINRLRPEDRGAFKKKIFVDKDIGTVVLEWPYDTPASPTPHAKIKSIFVDYDHDPGYYGKMDFRTMLKKRKYCKWGDVESCKTKTPLDRLFDEFRVASFERTLVELRARMRASSCAQARLHMALVLVSKCGARADSLGALLDLLQQRRNEPEHARAAVLRSLVRRARAWAAPAAAWARLAAWARGLSCPEWEHAALLRALLAPCAPGHTPPAELAAHRASFAALLDYPLTARERRALAARLPALLCAAVAEESEPAALERAVRRMLDALAALRVSPRAFPALIARIGDLAAADVDRVADILRQLYRDGIGRRELFRINFALYQNEDSYMNALRHDVDLISPEKLIKSIVDDQKFKYERFFRKIAIYFREQEGLSDRLLAALKENGRDKRIAKPLVLLLGDEVASFLAAADGSVAAAGDRSFAAALRASLHLARPALDVDALGWRTVGVKAVANKVLVCRSVEVDDYVTKLLQNKRTIKLSCSVAHRSSSSKVVNCFTALAKIKPSAALKLGLKLLKFGDNIHIGQMKIWEIIKPLIEKIKVEKKTKTYFKLPDISSMPAQYHAPYSVLLYNKYKEKEFYESMPFLCNIENLLPNVEHEFVESILLGYLNSDGLPKVPEHDPWSEDLEIDCNQMFIRIIVKYLLLSKTEEHQNKKIEIIGNMFFRKMETLLHTGALKNHRTKYIDTMLSAFLYHTVFVVNDYVSCLPVMTAALEWMQRRFPPETCFKQFVHMRLNMLYYTAIRDTIDTLPGRRINENNEMAARSVSGYNFGRYLAREVNTLENTHFSSIQYLLKDVIFYLRSAVFHRCETFTKSLINGILDENKGTGNVLAVHLFTNKYWNFGPEFKEHVSHRLRMCGNIEMEMVFYSETFLEI